MLSHFRNRRSSLKTRSRRGISPQALEDRRVLAVWINEIHYDNAGGDVGEFIEVAGDAGTNLDGYTIELYNGNGGGSYGTLDLSGTTIDDEGAGFGAVSFARSGIQNGDPDGLALVDNNGTVIEFLSYEGTFDAVGGPADGMTSVDIGAFESGSALVGESVQRDNTTPSTPGAWMGPQAESPGQLNTTVTGPTFTIEATDANLPEGDTGTTPFTFTVTRNNDTVGAATLDFSVSGSSGAPADANDFGGAFPTGLVNFADGEATQTVTIDVTGDTDVEASEGFSVTLSNASTGTITGASADGTIQNDDSNGGGANIWINELHYDNGSTDEGEFVEVAGAAGTDLAGYTLALYNGNGGVVYDTINLTGVIDDESNGFGALSFLTPAIQNGPDGIALVDPSNTVVEFVSYEGVVSATDGPAAGTDSVDIGVSESSATLVGESLQRDNATPGTPGAWGGPLDDSPGDLNTPPAGANFSIAATDAIKTEGDSGNTAFTFTVTRSNDTAGTASLSYTVAGSGANPVDADDFGGFLPFDIVQFADGEATQTITINVTGDTNVEADEDFTVTLSSPSTGTIVTASANGTIQNDDLDVTPPGIITLLPSDNAPAVPVGTNLVLRFDEPVMAGTGNVTIHNAADDSVVETIDISGAQVTFADDLVTIDLPNDLAPGTGYYVQVPDTAIDDLAGNGFAGITGSMAWSFDSAPSASSTAVVEPFNLAAVHTPLSSDGTVSPTTEYYGSGNDDPFSEYGVASFTYSLSDFGLSGGDTITDVLSVFLTLTHNDRSFSDGMSVEFFYTGDSFNNDYSALSYNDLLDNGLDGNQYSTPPQSLGVFNYAPLAAGGTTSTFTLDLAPVEAEVIDKLNAGEEFSIIIATTDPFDDITFSGLNNNFDPGNPQLRVTVNSTTGVDTTPPNSGTRIPADNARFVPTDTDLSISFNEDVQIGTGNITVRLSSDDSVVESVDVTAGQVVVSGDTVNIDLLMSLAAGTDYYVTIDAGSIEDLAGNDFAGISDPTAWNFTTIPLGIPSSLAAIHTGTGQGVVNPSDGYYGSGNDDAFAEYGIAAFRLTPADLGVPSGESITSITSATLELTHNERSFRDGDMVEFFLTTDIFANDYSGLAFDDNVINGINPAEFTFAPVSVGTFTYDPSQAGGTAVTYTLDFSTVEQDVIARLNAGQEFNILVTSPIDTGDVTFSGLDNTFDPGPPVLSLTVTSAANQNIPPEVTAGDDQTVDFGNLVQLDPAIFSDPDSTVHTITVDWGDGTVQTIGQGDIAVSGTATGIVETFNGAFDQPDWIFFDETGQSPLPATDITLSGNRLNISDNPADGNDDVFVSGALTGTVYSDVRVRALVGGIGGAPNNNVTISLRLDPNTLNAYILNLSLTTPPFLDIIEFQNGTPIDPPGVGEIDLSNEPAYNASEPHILEFEAIGNLLRARIFQADGVTQIGSDIEYTPTNQYAAGLAGLSGARGGVQLNGDPINVFLDDYTAASIQQITGSHSYATDGNFTATVSVTDDSGNTTTDTFTVTVNPPPPSFAIAADMADQAEGDNGTTPFTFTVTRSGDTAPGATLDYSVTGSGANPADAADFGGTLPSGTLSFNPGETTQTITINVSGDTVDEAAEGFTVTLSNASTGSIDTATADGTIRNDDSVTPPPTIFINEVDADQTGTDDAEFIELYDGGVGNTPLDGLVVVLFNGSDDASYNAFDLDGFSTDANGFFVLGVDPANVPNTGLDLPGSDNVIQNGADAVAIFQGDDTDFPNDTPVTDVNLIDAVVYGTNDSDASVLISTLTPGQAQINEGTSGTTSISRVPDGGTPRDTSTFVAQPPTPGVTNVIVGGVFAIAGDMADQAEGDSGTVAFTFTVSRTGDTSAATLDYAVMGSGANPADAADFSGTLPVGTVNFAAGETTQTITVEVSGDTIVEATEEFVVTLSNVSPGLIGTATATGTIQNDDTPLVVPMVAINEVRISSSGSSDNTSNFVEVVGDPDTALTGLTLVVLSDEFNPGNIDFAIDLSGGTSDANGFTLIGNDGTSAATDPGDVLVPSLDFFGSPQTFLIVEGFSSSAGTDLDADDDGTLDSMPWTAIQDSVSFVDGDANPDFSQSSTIIPADGSFTAAGAARLPDGTGTYSPLAFGDQSLDTPGATNVITGGVFSIAADNADQAEGDSGDTAFTFTVSRAGDTSAATLDYAVTGSGSDAADASDFGGTLPSGTLTFADGETEQTLTINVSGDTVDEPAEGFTVTISNASVGSIGTATADGTIRNDDAVTPPPTIFINEVDADTPGTDDAEFIELYDGGAGNTSLDGLVVVLFNGSDDASYEAFDLDGFSTDANGFFVIGNVPNAGLSLPRADNVIQNGADAVAILVGDATDFPNDTPVTDVNLIDAVVYGTNDSDDSGLLDVLTPGQVQPNDTSTDSISRVPDGGTLRDTSTFVTQPPTPGVTNVIQGGVFSIAADVADQAEGNIGVTPFTFIVSRTGDTSATTLTFAVTGSGSDAADGDDFGGSLPGGTLTFADGVTELTLTINVGGDTSSEPTETFTVTISNPSPGAIATDTADGTIQNDDATDVTPPTVAAALDQSINEGDTLTSFQVALFSDSDSTNHSATIDWGDGSAIDTGTVDQAGDTVTGTHTFTDDGTFTVTVTVIDGAGNQGTDTFTVTVANVAPTVNITGATTVNEGGTYNLAISPPADPGDDTVTDYIVDWGDGNTNVYTSFGTVTHTYDDGPSMAQITIGLTDEDGTYTDLDTLAVTINNVAPTPVITGPATGQPGALLTFAFSAIEPSADDSADIEYEIDWENDGTIDVTQFGPASGIVLNNTYNTPGTYTISVTATDNDGGSDTATATVIIADQQDPVVVIDGTLIVTGTLSSDRIVITTDRAPGLVDVRYNNQFFGPFAVSQIVVNALNGSDAVIVDTPLPAELNGGEGNDYLVGATADDLISGGPGNDAILAGEGDNVADGGEGNDRIDGRSGNDTFSGGLGNDRINGGGGDDIIDGGADNDLLNGGTGDDLIRGSAGVDTLNGHTGNDILVGGDAADQIFGRQGNDLLIGGADADRIQGGSEDDIVIGGGTNYDASDVALRQLLADWMTGGMAAVNAGSSPLTSSSVIGDNAFDDLRGDTGVDWFFSDGLDRIRDFRSDDIFSV